MPTSSELFDAKMENDPVHGPAFRATRFRPPELVKLSVKETTAYLEITVRTLYAVIRNGLPLARL